MARGMKKLEHASAIKTTGQKNQMGNADRNVETRIKDYSLNIHKALEKKIGSCAKSHVNIASKCGNYTIDFSTAAFEIARQVLINSIKKNQDEENEKFTLKIDKDKSGNIVSELIQILYWSALHLPIDVDYKGSCSVCIHIYRTASKIMINGKDSTRYVNIYLPAVERFIMQNADKINKNDKEISSILNKTLTNMNPGTSYGTTVTGNLKCKKCNRNVGKNAIQCMVCNFSVYYFSFSLCTIQ